MPDWLNAAFYSSSEDPVGTLLVREVLAFFFGYAVAIIYKYTHGRSGEQTLSFMATLVLLSVLIAMVCAVIGNNVARAFSLVGALSIVRFRTVVEDTRDTAFVIFAVAVGMAIGAGHLSVAAVSLPVAGIAAYLLRPEPAAPAPLASDFILTLRVGAAFADDPRIAALLDVHLASSRLSGVVTARQGSAIEKTFAVRLRDAAAVTPFVAALNAIEGVQGVELRRA